MTLRYVTFTVIPAAKGFKHLDRKLVEAEGVAPEAIHHMKHLSDGTLVALLEVSGDPDRATKLIERHNQAIEYEIKRRKDSVMYHSRTEPPEELDSLLSFENENGFSLLMPIEYTRDGGLEVTFVSDESTLQSAMAEMPAVETDVEILETGTFDADVTTGTSNLTSTQQEVLRVAVGLGYYNEPRNATQQDIADVMDCSAANVGEHLRRIEARLVENVSPQTPDLTPPVEE